MTSSSQSVFPREYLSLSLLPVPHSAVCRPSLAQYGEPGAGLFANNLATVVGWGRTSNTEEGPVRSAQTDLQQKLEIPAVDYGDCVGQYRTSLDIDISQVLRSGNG